MAEWLVQDGIGERRAALVEDGRLREIRLEWDDDPLLQPGAVLPARLLRRADATGRGLIRLDGDLQALLSPVPAGLAEGAALLVEIVREALPEGEITKAVRAKPAAPGAEPRPAPDLLARLQASGVPLRRLDARARDLDAIGWTEAIEEAESGLVTHPTLQLRVSLTPAMTLIDVDGSLSPAVLAEAGARAAGAAIRLYDLAGSIGIDLPTVAGKAERQAAALALDEALPPPFERTGVNGFGFLQLVRRRERRSVMERLQADRVGAAARALLHGAERVEGAGPVTLVAHSRIAARIERQANWAEQLAARLGAPVVLRPDDRLAISAGYAVRAHV